MPKAPKAFVKAFETYTDTVLGSLAQDGASPIVPESIQAFNELNVPMYTKKELLASIPACVDIIRQVSIQKFGTELPVMTTLSVGNPLLGNLPLQNPINFIRENPDVLKNFDKVGLDYYPGIWHIPKETAKLYWKNRDYFINIFKARNRPSEFEALIKNPPNQMFREAFGNMDLLEKTIQALQPYGKQLSISEVGAPTILALDNSLLRKEHEKWQELATRIMAMGLSRVMDTYNINEVSFYCLTNKPSIKKPPDSEGPFEWGWLRDTGEKKEILHARSLQRIIDIFRHPIQRMTYFIDDENNTIWVGSGTPFDKLEADAKKKRGN